MALIVMVACVRCAAAATATATVTATVIETVPVVSGLALTPPQLEMHGNVSGQVTLSNRSAQWRQVYVELEAVSGTTENCSLRFAPHYSELPPGGHQVLRLQFRNDPSYPCRSDYKLVISVPENHGTTLLTVPVYTASE